MPLGLSQTRYKMCVSGAAETGHCGLDAFDKAKERGRQVVLHNGIIITGATTGFPAWSAMGAKEAGGVSFGFSPASTEQEHLTTYRLPLEYLDLVVYTGFGFSGRNLILTRSADAVFIGCGRIGTINEFTIAYEDSKPIGILRGGWETDKVIEEIIAKGYRPNEKVLFDDDPKRLVERVVAIIEKDHMASNRVYRNPDAVSGINGNLIL